MDRSKILQSALLRVPRFYDVLAGPTRYRLMHRMGRVHEAEFRLLPSLVPSTRPLVLDVGGNIGQSVWSVKTVLPQARVITFEPNPANHARLQNLTRRFPDVTVETFGLGAESGERELFVPYYNGRAMSGLASFDRAAAASWLNRDTLYGFNADRLTVRQTTARVRRLDELGLEPDIIKIDVQGLEDAVVLGGRETISRSRPVILAETVRADSAAMGVLEPLGYRRLELHDGTLVEARDERPNQVLVPRMEA